MNGTLYLISSKASGLHKIGITRNWPQRCKQLEVGLKTDLVNRWTVNSPEQLEKYLHHRFKPHRLPQSEWFDLSADQVAWVISAASKAADDHQQASSRQPQATPAKPPAPAARPAVAVQPPAKPQPSPQPVANTSQGPSGWEVAVGLLMTCGCGWALMVLVFIATAANRPAASPAAAMPAPVAVPAAPTAEQLAAKAKSRAELLAKQQAEQAEQQRQRTAKFEAEQQKRQDRQAAILEQFRQERQAREQAAALEQARYRRQILARACEAMADEAALGVRFPFPPETRQHCENKSL